MKEVIYDNISASIKLDMKQRKLEDRKNKKIGMRE